MKLIRLIIALSLVTWFAGGCATTVEEVKYKLISKTENFELRDYPPLIVAETVVNGSLEEAGDKAFSRLFDYISGKNFSQNKIAMTAPVSREVELKKITMTAPVNHKRAEEGTGSAAAQSGALRPAVRGGALLHFRARSGP